MHLTYMDGLELLYITAAKAEIDNNAIGIGDMEKALQYIWSAYEHAPGNVKKLLRHAYDSINNGEPWKAKKLLEKALDKLAKPTCGLEEF